MTTCLFIGPDQHGTTSRARREGIEKLLGKDSVQVINMGAVWSGTSRIWRSLAFRLHRGPLLWTVNRMIRRRTQDAMYDICWVDKGILLTRATLCELREQVRSLVHYTPDTAFYGNHSRRFENTLPLYDLVVTTKSFELPLYRRVVDEEKLLLTTQGYDAQIHYPRHGFEDKEDGVVFVGLREPHREQVLRTLLQAGVHIILAGKGWERFVARHGASSHLCYRGDALWGEEYALALSSSRFGLGLLSKRFPELHTTRTFEIPACGTALLTEANEETQRFFTPEEAIFYADTEHLIRQIRAFQMDLQELQAISQRGNERVKAAGRSHESIVENILVHARVLV